MAHDSRERPRVVLQIARGPVVRLLNGGARQNPAAGPRVPACPHPRPLRRAFKDSQSCSVEPG
eukprot:15455863-Alexandrium_andersonii.AAC.1